MGWDEVIIFGFFDIPCVNNTSIAKGVHVWFCLILMVWRYSTEIKEIASGIVVNLIKFHQNAGNNYIFKKIQTFIIVLMSSEWMATINFVSNFV